MFDPLGIIAPVIMIGKCIFQNIWLHSLKWDDLVPHTIFTAWLKWRNELRFLNNFEYQRCIKPIIGNVIATELHVFADASELGYSAVIYLVYVMDDSLIKVNKFFNVNKLNYIY